MESASGLSTYCRKCGQYFRIERLAPPSKGGLLSLFRHAKPPAPTTTARSPSMPLQIAGFGEDGELMAQSTPHSGRSSSSEKEPPRPVVCFDCGHPHKVARASTSSLCPNCGCYIDLRDVVVKDRTTQKIRTRGDVVVEKKAALLGTSITCGNLTVHGQISGSIYASGEVIFKTSGKVLGEVRCKRLLVEKKSQIHFLQPVHADVSEIHGETIGNFHVERLLLSKHGSLQGQLSAKFVKMDFGAHLVGKVEILPRPLVKPSAPDEKPAAVASEGEDVRSGQEPSPSANDSEKVAGSDPKGEPLTTTSDGTSAAGTMALIAATLGS